MFKASRRTLAVVGGFQKLVQIQMGRLEPENNARSCGVISDGCFAAGTLLRTPTGLKAIESFASGDAILSQDEFDPRSGIVVREVQEVFRRYAPVLGVHLRRDGEEGPFVIRSTSEHPFYVSDPVYIGRWVAAGELQAGQWVLCDDGAWARVEEVADSGEWEVVYNMRVAEAHTYFVGQQGRDWAAWVHNAYITVTRYQKTDSADPDIAKHWSVEIEDDAGTHQLSHQKNDGTAPTGGLSAWESWHGKAETKVIKGKGPLKNSRVDKERRVKIEEEQATAAKAVVEAERARGKYNYDLYNDSCFVYVGRIMKAAGQPVGPVPPSDAASAARLLASMEAWLNASE